MVGSMAVYSKLHSNHHCGIVEWLSMSSLLFRFEWHGPTLLNAGQDPIKSIFDSTQYRHNVIIPAPALSVSTLSTEPEPVAGNWRKPGHRMVHNKPPTWTVQ